MVIFHSYVSLPEGKCTVNLLKTKKKKTCCYGSAYSNQIFVPGNSLPETSSPKKACSWDPQSSILATWVDGDQYAVVHVRKPMTDQHVGVWPFQPLVWRAGYVKIMVVLWWWLWWNIIISIGNIMRITNHQSRMLPKYVLLWAVLQTTTKDDQMCLIYLIYFTALPPRNYLMFQNIMFVLGEPYIVYIYTCIRVYIYIIL